MIFEVGTNSFSSERKEVEDSNKINFFSGKYLILFILIFVSLLVFILVFFILLNLHKSSSGEDDFQNETKILNEEDIERRENILNSFEECLSLPVEDENCRIFFSNTEITNECEIFGDECYYRVAFSKSDISYCEFIEEETLKDSCILESGLLFEDILMEENYEN